MRRPPAAALAAAPLLVAAALAGCVAGSGPAPGATGAAPTTPPATTTPSPDRPTEPPCVPAPLEDRAAAVLVVGLPHVTSADQPLAKEVADLGVGGVFVSEPNIEDLAQMRALADGLRDRAERPLLVSTDEESGRVAVTREIVGWGPAPRTLAATSEPDGVRATAAATGARLAEAGIDLDLAPVLDLDDGPWDGIIGDRSFSADPATASAYGLAFAAGLDDAGVLPTVKHFPGHGRSTVDTHGRSELIDVPLADLAETDLAPFAAAIDAGVPVVMLNHLKYSELDPDLPASMSPAAYALLRDLGFRGVAITDSVGMGPVHSRWDFPQAAVQGIRAGADAVLATDGSQAVRMRDALVRAVQKGHLDEARLDEAAARVTALAGGDPVAMSCLDLEVPRLEVTAEHLDPATDVTRFVDPDVVAPPTMTRPRVR